MLPSRGQTRNRSCGGRPDENKSQVVESEMILYSYCNVERALNSKIVHSKVGLRLAPFSVVYHAFRRRILLHPVQTFRLGLGLGQFPGGRVVVYVVVKLPNDRSRHGLLVHVFADLDPNVRL